MEGVEGEAQETIIATEEEEQPHSLEGCAHGDLDAIYSAIIQRTNNNPPDLLILCGDFQALRNESDFGTISMPDKYKELGSFWKYYTGVSAAPCLTILIGGNHEASGYMSDLFFGGWVAPSIYYLGAAGVVNVGSVRIAGYSGIHNSRHWSLGHYEAAPYDEDTIRSVYHTREVEVRRLGMLRGRGGNGSKADVCVSHDWPQRVAYGGNLEELFRKKKFLKKEVLDGSLGSPGGEWLMKVMRPSWWFSAHLHVRYESTVRHDPVPPGSAPQPDMVQAQAMPGGKGDCATAAGIKSFNEQFTRFLSLDKCLPRRQFLELLQIPRPPAAHGGEVRLEYDAEWMAILKKTERWSSAGRGRVHLGTDPRVTDGDISLMRERIISRNGGGMEIRKDTFAMTAPGPADTGGG
ncbi:hypothetical protein TrRE_jg3499, partial [Triparma retinervis]